MEKVAGLDDFEDLFAINVFGLEEIILNMGCAYNQDTSKTATSLIN